MKRPLSLGVLLSLGGLGLALAQTTFDHPFPNLGFAQVGPRREGEALFEKAWVADEPAIAGPLANELSCSGCHFRGGRSQPHPKPGAEPPVLLRLSIPSGTGEAPDPVYGWQLQDRGLRGAAAEGRVEVVWTAVPGRYADGTPYTLRRPRFRAAGLASGPLAPRTLISPRAPLPAFGTGLLEVVPDAAILALADPDDRDGDGISGRPNRVWSARDGRVRPGRFGWKASQPTVEQQIAIASSEDLGLTTALYPEPNVPPGPPGPPRSPGRSASLASPVPELSEPRLARLLLYVRTLAAPDRRDASDPAVIRGGDLFVRTGCAACHHPTFQTGESPGLPELAGQTLHPYTDLLLHDLGPGLADGRPDGEATGREWRTPPLWGLGLLEPAGGPLRLLHDGRARTPEEAILWHGGEAEASRERFRRMDAADRGAVIRFLRSL